jgi:hypothetical protein
MIYTRQQGFVGSKGCNLNTTQDMMKMMLIIIRREQGSEACGTRWVDSGGKNKASLIHKRNASGWCHGESSQGRDRYNRAASCDPQLGNRTFESLWEDKNFYMHHSVSKPKSTMGDSQAPDVIVIVPHDHAPRDWSCPNPDQASQFYPQFELPEENQEQQYEYLNFNQAKLSYQQSSDVIICLT